MPRLVGRRGASKSPRSCPRGGGQQQSPEKDQDAESESIPPMATEQPHPNTLHANLGEDNPVFLMALPHYGAADGIGRKTIQGYRPSSYRFSGFVVRR